MSFSAFRVSLLLASVALFLCLAAPVASLAQNIPSVTEFSVKDIPLVPDGCKTANKTSPVISFDDLKYWPLSYRDNRVGICVVGFNAKNEKVFQKEFSGARYITDATVDEKAKTVTFTGQAKKTVTIPWEALMEIPVVSTIAFDKKLPVPEGSKEHFYDGPGNPKLSKTFQVVSYKGNNFYPFSFRNNRGAINLVGYDAGNKIVFQQEIKGARYIWKVEADTKTKTIVFYGQDSKTVSIPWQDLVVVPSVKEIALEAKLSIPEKNTNLFFVDPEKHDVSKTFQVISWKGLSYYPFSYRDNRMAINLVGYDEKNKIVSQQELKGARYIWKIVVDENDQKIIFYGQGNNTVELPWNKL